MLRSSLKKLIGDNDVLSYEIFTMRPEQLDYKDFVKITKLIEE
jgi:hypothetical protein